MKTYKYNISGMSCNSCAEGIERELLKLKEINKAIVQTTAPQAVITAQVEVPLDLLQSALNKVGNYTIMKADESIYLPIDKIRIRTWVKTYKPVLIIGLYIFTITLLIESTRGKFEIENWMSNFMSGFFLIFSFFKFLDLKGFADAYFTYDVVAKRWYNWGYMYAFIEVGLGVAYMLKFNLLIIDSITLVIMLLSLLGVLQSIFNKREIKCACLGTIFNLPMGTLTIIENVLMIYMSIMMLILKIFKN